MADFAKDSLQQSSRVAGWDHEVGGDWFSPTAGHFWQPCVNITIILDPRRRGGQRHARSAPPYTVPWKPRIPISVVVSQMDVLVFSHPNLWVSRTSLILCARWTSILLTFPYQGCIIIYFLREVTQRPRVYIYVLRQKELLRVWSLMITWIKSVWLLRKVWYLNI